MQTALSEFLNDKYIICSCEGTAEEAIIDLLLDNSVLCFSRDTLVDNQITRLRKADKIAEEFLNREYQKDIAILRIIDRDKDKFKLPRIYTEHHRIEIFDVVTKPEIEILHIIDEDLLTNFIKARTHDKNLKPSEFCKSHFGKNVKNKDFIEYFYASDIEKLINAIKNYAKNDYSSKYSLNDLLSKA